ncbi:vgr related protein [Altericroceibacterium xinjiangense]|uniref:vgr related protein n=1 Tax=Altericroceibacterium xinjiangense TaxID=762261 RepID=UPI000F7E6EB7|nr:vgr related protein [Altericroceibacterium xinjiangense]
MRRILTPGERELAHSVFGDALKLDGVTINRKKWFPFQPSNVVMAPNGHIWVHPKSKRWSEDYSKEPLALQGLLIHELTHVLQVQRKGRWYLILMRHPFCRYGYEYQPGWPLERYGIEQQAELVRHAFLRRNGYPLDKAPSLAELDAVVDFKTPEISKA